MLQNQILPTVSMLILSLAVAGCMRAESGEYQTVSTAEVAQAEADQLKPKTLEGYQDDALTAPNDSTQVASNDTNPKTPKVDATQAAVSETNPNAKTDASTGDDSTDSPDAKQTAESNTDNGNDLGPRISEKGAAFMAMERIKNRNRKIEPREVKLLIPEKTFRTEGPQDALRVSFDDIDLLKVLNMEPVVETAPQLFPEWLKQLDGKRIRLRGFMYPAFRDTDLKGFVLARDNQICCFGRSPKIYDLVTVLMRKGKMTDYIQGRPFDVVGVVHIEESEIAGEMFWMNDAVVIGE